MIYAINPILQTNKPHPPQFNLLEVTKHLHIVLSLLIAFSSARGAVGAGGMLGV